MREHLQNADFQKLNTDTSLIPALFKPKASGVNFNFCLAQRDPNGNPTTGIIHKQTTVTSFSTDDKVKSSAQGGDDAWDVEIALLGRARADADGAVGELEVGGIFVGG